MALQVSIQCFVQIGLEPMLMVRQPGLAPCLSHIMMMGLLILNRQVQQGVDDQQINPLTSIGNDDLIKAFQRRYQFQHNFYGELKILKDLKFRTTFGYGWSQNFNSNYTGPNTVFNTNATTAGSNLSQQIPKAGSIPSITLLNIIRPLMENINCRRRLYRKFKKIISRRSNLMAQGFRPILSRIITGS